MQSAEEDFTKAVNYIFRDKRRYSIHEKKKNKMLPKKCSEN